MSLKLLLPKLPSKSVTKARSLDSDLGVSPATLGASLQSHRDPELGRQQGHMARLQPTDPINMALEISRPGCKCPGAQGG